MHVVLFPRADPGCADWAEDLRGLPPDTGEGWTESKSLPAGPDHLAVVIVALVAGLAALLAVVGRAAAIRRSAPRVEWASGRTRRG